MDQGRYVARAALFLALVALVVGALGEVVLRAFLHNPLLNGLILAILALGIAYNLRRMVQLWPERRWIEAFRAGRPGYAPASAPRLVAPIAQALGEPERRGRATFSALSIRYLLDSIQARLDESREIARYMTGLMIFLGLLGTFWGLLESIGAVGGVITGLAVGGDAAQLFEQMKEGLARPLAGMGTAFSASLFGLAGSLVLGFLDLQAGQAQNAFTNELEEWLASMARLAGAELSGEAGGPPIPVYVQALLEQTAENLERLQATVARTEDGRQQLGQAVVQLNDRLGLLAERIEREQDGLRRLAEAQGALVEQLGRRPPPLLDEATREHLRATDLQLARTVEELVRLREELKAELKLVARTIALAAGEPPPPARG
jgi:hypothetical protein